MSDTFTSAAESRPEPQAARPDAAALRARVSALRLPDDLAERPRFAVVRWLLVVVVLGGGGWWLWTRWQAPAANDDSAAVAADDSAGPARPATTATTSAPEPATRAGASPPATGVARTSATGQPATLTLAPAVRPVPREGAPPPPAGSIVLESKGYLIPTRQILVSPKVTGMVESLDIEEGRRVAKGDVLAQLENVEYLRDVERATALLELAQAQLLELETGSRPEEIGQAEAELAQAKEELVELERTYRRNQELRRQNVATVQDLEKSESEYLATLRRIERLTYALTLLRKGAREERIAVARAQVRQAEAELGKARWRLDNCTIRAPITGVILKKNAEEGNIVNPMAFNGSFSLCEMADLSDLEVDLAIQERDISRVFVGQRCRILSEAYPDRPYEGVVSRLMPRADRAKGAIPVRVKVEVPAEEQGTYLKPDMGVIVSFYGAAAEASPPR